MLINLGLHFKGQIDKIHVFIYNKLPLFSYVSIIVIHSEIELH